jgi:hypothetical protein
MSERPICQIVTPVGMLGYGFDYDTTVYELANLVPNGVPTAIILDSGSTDSGPEKLALGNMSCPRNAYYRDLKRLMKLVYDFRVPLIFGSAGGDGADEHVKELLGVIEEICALEENKSVSQHLGVARRNRLCSPRFRDYCFKTLSVLSSIDKATVLERLGAGRVAGCGVCVPPLTTEDVEQTPRIVAQLGPEPYIDLMEANPDFNIIVGGRTYDPATYVAYAVYQLKLQFPKLSEAQIEERYGGFVHMGKIMECGGLCSSPKSHGAVATVYSSGLFDVRPTAPESRCTPYSIAAHALYENGRPDVLNGPGGSLHLLDCKYDQLPIE